MENKNLSPLAVFVFGFIVAYCITKNIKAKLPTSPRPFLEEELILAVKEERYEDAAKIRDLLIDINRL